MDYSLKYIGTSQPIHDANSKTSGQAKYACDYFLPNMVYVSLVYSEIPHGYVKAIHAEDALALPGVLCVYHYYNTPHKKYNRYRSNFDQDNLPDEELVFHRYVRFVGDRIAAVAAEDRETAERAAKLIKVEYEELSFSIGFDDTLGGKNCLDGEQPIKDEFSFEIGSAPSEEGLIAVDSRCEIPRLHHATMETHACVASYDPFDRQMTIYSPNQSTHGIRTVISRLLDMPESHVRVIKSMMGGSFGAKQEWFVEPVAALIAKELGRCVKLVYSRAESMRSAIVRGAMRSDIHALYSEEGELRSLSIDLLMDAGAYIGSSGDYIRSLSGKLFRCYWMPHVKFRARIISSNTPVAGAFRGWSAPEIAIMLEHHMDKAAKRLGMDRVDFRLKNVEMPFSSDRKNGLSLEDIRIADALRRGSELFTWNKRKSEIASFNSSNRRFRRGIGVGIGGHGNTYYPRFNDYAEGHLWLNADGSVQSNFSIHDHGCGTVQAMRMIVAESLKVDDCDVSFPESDTAVSPIDFGCFASRTIFVIGRAVSVAADDLKDLMLQQTSALYGKAKDDLFLEEKQIRSKTDFAFRIPYSELAKKSMHEYGKNLSVSVQYRNTTNPGVTGAHFAYVEVDTWTGFTKVLDYLAVQDIGQPINRGMCIAQIQGAAQMGCGAALREKLVIDKNGRCTEHLAKYLLFLAPDLPNIRVELLTDGKSEMGPFGAKSVGEVCYIPAAPAVCSAVNDALCSELDTLPFDPDTILKYLEKER